MSVRSLHRTGLGRAALALPDGADRVAPGQVVALALSHPADFAAAFSALTAAGAVPLVLPPHLPEGAQRQAAEQARAAALWRDEGGQLRHHPLGTAPRVALRGYLACTSGTSTGRPKVFAFDLERAEGNARAHLASLGVLAARRIVLPMPITHSFGVVAGLLAARLLDAELLAFEDTPTPAALLQVLAEHESDLLYLTPPLLRLLLKRSSLRAELTRWAPKVVSVGAGAVDRDELRALVAATPRSRVTFTYGLTELGPRVATLLAGEAGHARLEAGSGRAPLGEPVEGVQLRLEQGRLWVRSPYATLGRVVDGQLIPLAARGGFVDTGDAAEACGAQLEIIGRADGVVVRGGTNVYPEDVEAVALRDDAVSACACVPESSAMYGQVPVLYCESASAEGPLRARLEARLVAELRPVERPVRIHIVPQLPRSALGKVVRAALMDPSTPSTGSAG